MKNKKLKNHYIDRYYKYHYSKDGGSWEVKKLKNDCLYYSGLNRNYATKIKKEDLPENFMNFWDGISWNFLNSAGVVDILYQPVINNHVFRDDSLYISYTDKIKYKKKYEDIDECFNWFEVENAEQYERIWGGEIIEFLLFAAFLDLE